MNDLNEGDIDIIKAPIVIDNVSQSNFKHYISILISFLYL